MIDLTVYAASWLMMFFCVFAIFQTVGVNLAPAWAKSRVFLGLAVIIMVAASNVIMV